MIENPVRYIRRILWTLDPTLDDEQAIRKMVPFLRKFGESADIYPVYVLGLGALNFPIGAASESWPEQYRSVAETRLNDLLEGLELPGMQAPVVLVEAQTTRDQAVRHLLEYAEKLHISSIVVNAHAHSRMSRLLLGSFAQTLMVESSIPVLSIELDRMPETVTRAERMTILFPTDFSAASRRVFRAVVREAHLLNAKLILFHTVPQPIEPYLESGASLLGGVWIPVHSAFGDEIDRHRRHAEAWARWATHQGVEASVLVDNFGGDLVESIVSIARSNSAMIAMSGPVSGSMIESSITKQVLRTAQAPVWVFHPASLSLRGEQCYNDRDALTKSLRTPPGGHSRRQA
ncbi:MAG: universal stress protein [Oligoflexia bacterium]|nr:universal stress protein [Oligoflexia bacterium]